MGIVQRNYIVSSPDVIVDKDGHLGVHLLDDTTLAPCIDPMFTLSYKAARDLALSLLQGIERGVYRNQVDNPAMYTSEWIEYRANSKRGLAIAAVKRIDGC